MPRGSVSAACPDCSITTRVLGGEHWVIVAPSVTTAAVIHTSVLCMCMKGAALDDDSAERSCLCHSWGGGVCPSFRPCAGFAGNIYSVIATPLFSLHCVTCVVVSTQAWLFALQQSASRQ